VWYDVGWRMAGSARGAGGRGEGEASLLRAEWDPGSRLAAALGQRRRTAGMPRPYKRWVARGSPPEDVVAGANEVLRKMAELARWR
jgi:hypothetical protein